MDIAAIISELIAERDKLQQVINALERASGTARKRQGPKASLISLK